MVAPTKPVPLRPGLMPVPQVVLKLPRDERGYPVPWFVHWQDGKPDFRVIGAGKVQSALANRLCWICGQRLGESVSFVIGPMCAVNRVSAEPPSHQMCAEFAARACPFLTQPKAVRRVANLPPAKDAPGIPIARNPGVALVWRTKSFGVAPVEGGVLLDIGEPDGVVWFAEGRKATRAEVLASIHSGLPALREMAEAEGPAAVKALADQLEVALALIPQEAR